MQVTVLGATGGTGRAIVTELAARGHSVTAASRSVAAQDLPDGVRAEPTDLLDADSARRACEGAEVVVMAAAVPYSRWATDLVTMVDAAIDAAAHAGARLVMVDNLYAYGAPDAPISEDTPEAATTRKGQLRAELGRRLLAAHEAGRVRVTIGRFSDYYGPQGGNSLVAALAIDRAVTGKAPRIYLDGEVPHTFAYLPDVARAFAALVEHPEADGQVWVLPAAPAITQRELFTAIADAAGVDGKLGRIGPAMLALAGLFNRELREARELTEQFVRPWVTDASAFEAAFGPFTPTPHEQAVAETVAAARRAVSPGAGSA